MESVKSGRAALSPGQSLIPLTKVRRTQSECVSVAQFVAGPFGGILSTLDDHDKDDESFWQSEKMGQMDSENCTALAPISARQQSCGNLGEVCLLPCHSSTKDAIKRITPATVR